MMTGAGWNGSTGIILVLIVSRGEEPREMPNLGYRATTIVLVVVDDKVPYAAYYG